MRSPNELEQSLKDLLAAWERLAPADSFAGLTHAEFKAAVQASFSARTRLQELRLDFHQWLLQRELADVVSSERYQQVVLGIRCHPGQGNNSSVLRAVGYVTELERASGLGRTEDPETPPLPPPAAT